MMEVNFLDKQRQLYLKIFNGLKKDTKIMILKKLNVCKYPIIPFCASPKINENKKIINKDIIESFQ